MIEKIKSPHKGKKSHWDRVKERTMSGKVASRIKKLYEKDDPIKVIIYNNLCPGDILQMEPAIRMLHQQYPGRFITDVACFHPTLFDNHPNITKLDGNDSDVIHLWTTYPLVNKTNQRTIYFADGYLDWFKTQFDIDLVLDTNRPYIYLTEEEKKNSLVEQLSGVKNYILFSAGWKNDYTIKRYSVPFMQEVVNHFKDRIPFVQIGISTKKFHNHPPLENVISLIDKTSVRQLAIACYHSQAGIGPVTCILHMFAAFQRPYASLHGGREPYAWTQHLTQKVFGSIGTLDCCKVQGCWRSRVVPLGDGDKKDKRCCEMPMIDTDNRPIAKCMLQIKPNQIIEYIETLIENGMIKT